MILTLISIGNHSLDKITTADNSVYYTINYGEKVQYRVADLEKAIKEFDCRTKTYINNLERKSRF